jgi:hypothetical protein
VGSLQKWPAGESARQAFPVFNPRAAKTEDFVEDEQHPVVNYAF